MEAQAPGFAAAPDGQGIHFGERARVRASVHPFRLRGRRLDSPQHGGVLVHPGAGQLGICLRGAGASADRDPGALHVLAGGCDQCGARQGAPGCCLASGHQLGGPGPQHGGQLPGSPMGAGHSRLHLR